MGFYSRSKPCNNEEHKLCYPDVEPECTCICHDEEEDESD